MAAILLVLVGTVVLIGVVLMLDMRGARSAPLDTERAEQWFVRHAPGPLRRGLDHVDRRFAGGAAIVVLFGIVLAIGTLVGWLLDTVDEERGFARWDDSAAEWGAANHTEASTRALEIVTQLGASGWLLAVMGVVGVGAWVRRRRPGPLAYLVVVGLGVSALNNALKHLIDRERPDVLQLTSFGSSSFPSGHTAAAAACWAAIALVVARHWSRRGRTAAAAVAMLITVGVAASRVLLGVHWLTDVIAGVFVGWGWFLVVTVLFGGRLLRFGEPAERMGATDPDRRPVAAGGTADPDPTTGVDTRPTTPTNPNSTLANPSSNLEERVS